MKHATTTVELDLATQLADALAKRNIPADVHPIRPDVVVVSIFVGLVVRIHDGTMRWTVPDVTGARERPLLTYARTVPVAAARIAENYQELRSVPLEELLATGRITPLAAALLDESRGATHGAAPI